MKTSTNSNYAMPLLMNFTPATRIEEETELLNIVYDEQNQIVYDMRTIGTKSLKRSSTKKKSASGKSTTTVTDKKNEIDDFKIVK